MKLAASETKLPPSNRFVTVVSMGLLPRSARLLASAILLLASSATAVHGQSALDGFDSSANDEVHIVVLQPDGKILLGGRFTNVLGVARNRIARLNPDGSLDMAFNPNANNMIYGLALQADGKILVGGLFEGPNSIGGQTRNHIARLEPVTGLADAFDPNANNDVAAIAVQPDGKILVAGSFNGANSIGGQTRNHIARLDPMTGLADAFDPNANQVVFTLALQPDGKILAGGVFSGANCIGGQTRNYLARLDPTTGLADSFNANASNAVLTIAVQPDGKIVAGGSFTGIGGQVRNRIARLDPVTALADTFNPNANNIVFATRLQPDGKILAGGVFDNIGGLARSRIARLDPFTGLADSFNPSANAGGNIDSIAVQSDGKIVVGGAFTNFTPNGGPSLARSNIARLEADGRLDRTLVAPVTGSFVTGIAIQPDGEILMGGGFSSILGIPRSCIARLNTDGTTDTGFDPDANNSVLAIAVQPDSKILLGGAFSTLAVTTRYHLGRVFGVTGVPDTLFGTPIPSIGSVTALAIPGDGRILVGGSFTNIYGVARNRIARLNSTNGVADAFNPNANGDVNSIAVQPDGSILAGGDFNGFTSIGGQSRNGIARLDATTGLAEPFDPNANNGVYAVAAQPDGKILLGGAFTSIQGTPRNRIARLNPDGTLDLAFNPDADASVFAIVLQTDGRILIGGSFTNVSAQVRTRIARLDPVTGAADSFAPNVTNGIVYALAIQPDGKILAGGTFFSVNGQGRSRIARLSNDAGAQQNLAVSPATVTWTHSGAGPQLTRTTFEYSTSNTNYLPLGNGTASGANWTLTGLNLPTGTNLWIRARGYYRSGYLNGSECLTESVRNVYLTPLPRLDIERGSALNVVLSWGTNFTGFTLEASTNLNPDVWSVVSPAPSVTGTNNVVTNASSGSQRFYRLRK